MSKQRFAHIDFLRAIAIIGVIITHLLSYGLGTTLTNTLWNYLHFVVPAFIFCSGYVTYRCYSDIRWTRETLVAWYKKRATRLITPYLLWTSVHYTLWYVFPAYFSGLGLDYSWLPILFLELMIVTPLYLSLWKIPKIRAAFTLVIAVSTVFLLFIKIPVDYQLDMWIPWSAILLLSFIASGQTIKKIQYIWVACIALLLFLIGNILLSHLSMPLTLTLHKYPPDIFYLSYGIGIGSILLLVEPSKFFQHIKTKAIIRWLSVHSYELFFAHYILLDCVITLLRHSGK